MVTKLVIVGAGGHAKVVADAVSRQNKYAIAGFIDESTAGSEFGGHPVHAEASNLPLGAFVVAIGNNETRKRIFDEMIALGWEPATVLHPAAVLAGDVQVGPGTVIFAGAIVNADASIGSNCIVNTGATIDHDCLISDHVHIAPGCNLAGQVMVGEGVFLGIGTSAIPQVRIGAWAVAGAGTVILADVDGGTTVVGVPARAIKK